MNSINRCKPLLGTYVEIDISGNFEDKILLQISKNVFSKIEKIESLMSFHNDESELSYINSNAFHHSCAISDEMREVIGQALEISKLTDGIYDISIGSELVKNGFLPNRSIEFDEDASFKDIFLDGNKIKFNKRMQLDLGGIAKGYAVDQALLEVKDKNVEIVINAGGDLVMNNWEDKYVNIRIPNCLKSELKSMKMQNKAVATSASYYFNKNKNPIISAKTKEMVSDKRSISVFAPNCMLADALTKVAFLSSHFKKFNKYFGAQAFAIDEKGAMEELCQQ
ncbi:MAG: thiamine biosynthesis lipoprotein [Lentimonas sp.]|jgi:thiamine biosynthesis lipoprotein